MNMNRKQAWEFLREEFAKVEYTKYNTGGLCLGISELNRSNMIDELTFSSMRLDIKSMSRIPMCSYFWPPTPAGNILRVAAISKLLETL